MSDTVSILKRALAFDFRIIPLPVPDVPVFLAVAWPLTEAASGLRPRLPAGRGVTPLQAMVSAGAEALELRASLAQNHAADIAGLERHAGQAMVAATDLGDGRKVSVAAEQVYLDFAALEGGPIEGGADSTGCATGHTRDSATLAALLECIERDAMALWWHGGLVARSLSLDQIDDLQPRLFWWLSERDRQTFLLDISTDTAVPVVVAVSADGQGRRVAVGSAAHPDPRRAALSAVTEMIQTEAAFAQADEAGDPEFLRWCDVGWVHTMPQFQAVQADPQPMLVVAPQDPASGVSRLVHNLATLGHRALGVDLSLPGDPLPTVRVLVPGLCAMGGRFQTPRFQRLATPAAKELILMTQDWIEPY